MRLIDVCIPHFGDEENAAPSQPTRNAFQLPATLFGQQSGHEYNIEDDDQQQGTAPVAQEEQFFEAEDGSSEVRPLFERLPQF
jgi:hypothetical protein